MAEPPPRKIGSLRDRIAAFENKGPAPTPERAPPAPRPKPAGMQWKPRAATPPPPADDGAVDSGSGENKPVRGGMSAADAKESIQKGGSLKERMAALQGLSTFGGGAPAPATSPPPRPSGEKPRWKPPVSSPSPQPHAGVTSPSDEKTEDEATTGERVVSPPPAKADDEPKQDNAGEASEAAEQTAEEPQEPDAEEEERQRRAAIAARMARLGGARIGFAPPVVAKKPEVKKHEEPKVEESKAEEKKDDLKETEPVTSPAQVQSPSAEEVVPPPAKESSGEYFGTTNASASSLLSPELGSTPSSAPRSPAMPVPAAPRRAAPPRKKNAKTPAPPTPAAEPVQTVESPTPGTPHETSDDTSKSLQEDVRKSKEDEAALGLAPAEIGSGDSHHLEEIAADVESEHKEASTVKEPIEESESTDQPSAQASQGESSLEPEKAALAEEVQDKPASPVTEAPVSDAPKETVQPVEEPETIEQKVEEPEQHEDEEDETARRKRIAERLRQQGGFNPFAAPPIRRQSTASVESVAKSPRKDASSPGQEVPEPSVRSPRSPPPPPRRQSTRRSSTDSTVLPPSAGLARRTSVDSTHGPADEHPAAPIRSASVEHERKSSVDPVAEQAEEKEEKEQAVDPREHQSIANVISEEPEDDFVHSSDAQHHSSEALSSPEHHDHHVIPSEEQVRESEVAYTATEERDEDHEPPRALSPHVAEEVQPVRNLPPPPKRVSLPPPPRALPALPQEQPSVIPREASPETIEPESDNSHEGQGQQSAFTEEPEAEEEDLHSTPHFPHPDDQEEVESEREQVEEPLEEHRPSPISPTSRPVPPPRRQSTDIRSPTRSLPPPPAEAPVSGDDDQLEEHEEHQDIHTDARSPTRSLPPPPPPSAALPVLHAEEPDLHYTPVDDEVEDTTPAESVKDQEYRQQNEPEPPLKVVTQRDEAARQHSRQESSDRSEREVLDDSDVDPIDPGFVSPQRTSTSSNFPPIVPQPAEVAHVSTIPPVAEEPTPEPQEDEEQARRRTLAERMAKLGGIRFGAPPPIGRRPPPPPRSDSAEHEHVQEAEETQDSVPERAEEHNEEPEEDEAARRQRIAARLAGAGGIRFGMFPTPAAPPRAPPVPAQPTASQGQEEEEEAPPPPPPRLASHPPVPAHPPPPPRSAPVPPPPQVLEASDEDEHSDSVQVEAEESELEEVTHDDAEEEQPPPIPSREARRTSVPPPSVSPASPHVRPPVPIARPPPVPPTTSRPHVPTAPSHGDFVMVEESDVADEPPPLPPPRSVSLKKGPPARSAPPPPPPPPPPAEDLTESVTSQWEPTVDFGGETDLSLSGQWSEDSTQYPAPPAKPTHPPPPPINEALLPPSATLDPDELIAQWGRVGVQIHEVAITLHEKSRKSLIGDRSYIGFILAVLNQVPNAQKPTPPFDTFGHLIYEQSGGTVLRHVADIMPGDIIVLHDAKLKGHKGIQIYNQHVGAHEPVAAVVGDFETKKSKVKALQANQHVGHDSVEAVSYRLEDLKSGSVKIFRVLEA